MEKSLWGNLDDLMKEVHLPKDILNEQAEYLQESLDELVRGRVVAKSLSNVWKEYFERIDVMGDFVFSFVLFSDYVEKYEYEICQLVYGIKLYPVAIVVGEGIAEEMVGTFDLKEGDTIIVKDEEELLHAMQTILSSKEVHQVLRGLVSIAKKEKESKFSPF